MVVGCSDNTINEEGKDIKELVHDYSVGNFDDVTASITSHELIVTENNESEIRYDLPKDEFFVSIAPFIEHTHECAIHSLTGCQGELVEEEFNVYIEDEQGNVVVDETMTSFANGFIDLWLPRDKNLHVSIEHNGKVSETDISTFEGDKTCITTMQLL
nr:CueP family metal-binding protein [Oceanobacillus senegalensis]